MTKKIWFSTEISTDAEQDIRVQPTPEFDGITIEFKEAGDPLYKGNTLYLDRDTMEILIIKMRETMDYAGK